MTLTNTNIIVKDSFSLYNIRLINQENMIDKIKVILGECKYGNETIILAKTQNKIERDSETFTIVIDINRFISKLKKIQTSLGIFFKSYFFYSN